MTAGAARRSRRRNFACLCLGSFRPASGFVGAASAFFRTASGFVGTASGFVRTAAALVWTAAALIWTASAFIWTASAFIWTASAFAQPPRPLDADPEFVREVQAESAERRRTHPPISRADGDPAVLATPRFLYVHDAERALPEPPWGTPAGYAAAFALAHESWAANQPDRARLIMVFTTFDEGGESLFYVPMANDVVGLGAGPAGQIFDDTPNSAVDGYAWMGSLSALLDAGPIYQREAFTHEIAHRWSAYLSVDHPDLAQDALRGRQAAHWSFFVDSGASPMEGNRWHPVGPGAYTTQWDDDHAVRFSPVDLYLMGVHLDHLVPDFRVVASFTHKEPTWLTVTAETQPAHRQGVPVTLRGAVTATVTMRDLIAANGHRDPAAVSGPVDWPIGVVLLSTLRAPADLSSLESMDATLRDLDLAFTEATGGRMRLDLALSGAGTADLGSPCASLAACDRTRADRCAPALVGEATICTRACGAHAECGDLCCLAVAGERLCGAVEGPCPRLPAVDAGNPGGGPVPEVSSGCDCTSAGGPPSAGGLGILVALALLRWRRLG